MPCVVEDPTNILEGKSNDLAIMEAMKKNFKLEKEKKGYTISNINNPAVKVVTQILVGKVMWKCYANEVPMLVVSLTVQCRKGV